MLQWVLNIVTKLSSFTRGSGQTWPLQHLRLPSWKCSSGFLHLSWWVEIPLKSRLWRVAVRCISPTSSAIIICGREDSLMEEGGEKDLCSCQSRRGLMI